MTQATGGGQTPAANPRTRVVRVKLGELVLRPDDYAHRKAVAFAREALKPLMTSIAQEGLRHRPEVFKDKDGRYVLVTGHRRVKALLALAEDGVAGYAADMEIEVTELLDVSPHDLLIWSVADNEVRLNLSVSERLIVVRRFVQAAVPEERAATALGLSIKQFQRDAIVARHEWMTQLVDQDAVPATTAVELLEAADKAGRLAELKSFMADWVAETELAIETEAAKRAMRPGETRVRNRLTPDMKRHWLDQLAAGKELDTTVHPRADVSFDIKTLQLKVGGKTFDLMKDPLEDLARKMSALSQATKAALPFLARRASLEGDEGPQAQMLNAGDVSQYDEDYLRDAGLDHLGEQPKASPPKAFGGGQPPLAPG